jgi:hypothetical protein
MTSRLGSLVAAALLAIVIAVPASAATTFELYGQFKESFGRPANAELCDLEPPFCGAGTVRGLGSATTLFYPGGTKTITLDSDGSTLVMHETLVLFETPGASADAPGSLVSFGNPYYLVVSWEADPNLSTGIFAGATGSGTTSVVSGGDAIIVTTVGTLTLQ